VNPAHLQAITQQQNCEENLRAGRIAHFHKLTPRQVIDIVRSDLSESELARKYAVSRTTIRRVKNL
jgi:response regulator of citrate/malate metabolism